MISIKIIKEIRENLKLSHLVMWGYNGKQECIATHGKTIKQSKEAAEFGNKIKKNLKWLDCFCCTEPLDRTCRNCSFWQQYQYKPGAIIPNPNNSIGHCMFLPKKTIRYEFDRACKEFESVA